MAEIHVRAAAERDYPAIARIQQRAPEAAQWPVGDYSNFEMLLALAGAEPAGFCAWRQSAPGEAELLNIAVDPDFRRQGVASALIQTLSQAVCGSVFLEVAENNSGAIALYETSGFRPVGLRKGYYSLGKINAVVMKKSS